MVAIPHTALWRIRGRLRNRILRSARIAYTREPTLVFLARKWAIDSMVAAAIYVAGFTIKWLLG